MGVLVAALIFEDVDNTCVFVCPGNGSGCGMEDAKDGAQRDWMGGSGSHCPLDHLDLGDVSEGAFF